ncbi:MAG: winged helix-turn-helix domain-containing protein [Vicinamibacterales bacterium]
MVGAPKRGDRIDREAILALLNESRPVTVTGLASALGVSRQAVQYHLRVLRRAGLVDRLERGPRSRWRTTDAVPSGPDPAGKDDAG